MMNTKILIISTMFFRLEFILCSNSTQVRSLHDSLFKNYNRKLFPLLDHNDTVKIACTVGIVSINNFNELSGEIEITMLFYMQWSDERLSWTPSEFGGKSNLLIPPKDVWHPQLFVLQSFDRIQEITNVSMLMRLLSSGKIIWNPGNVLKLVCSVDVTYFPFDTQDCYVTISGWAYTNEEVLFYTTESMINKDFLSQNSQWIISSATVENRSAVVAPSFPPSLNIRISLKRRSDFFVVYIIVPMMFLSCMNNLVFIMPANSGERTSVAITTFLSFIVFMQMINSTVPQSSDPMAYIYFYVLFLLIYSSVILFLCILSLRIHDRDAPVPSAIVKLVYVLRCWWLKRKKIAVVKPERKMSSVSEEIEMKHNKINENTEKENETPSVTWKTVGKTFDLYCFLILYFIFIVMTANTFSNLYYNRKV
ncbi:neuronal acetylcholine receptor subunit alpha-5-like [Ruditapes philippinarum]|uniref:neuronal acetylcholine receptor subunit alpha-5-like n=1 Tax=Ruditapes philippinarum TaxID=129788 RepID=UPI00295AE3A1|nr:neuronal acetylcholine receptor subunit alpha-5-like [Ruditapes philippinarum]